MTCWLPGKTAVESANFMLGALRHCVAKFPGLSVTKQNSLCDTMSQGFRANKF